jgi:membrane-associated phospholipid phosphatase
MNETQPLTLPDATAEVYTAGSTTATPFHLTRRRFLQWTGGVVATGAVGAGLFAPTADGQTFVSPLATATATAPGMKDGYLSQTYHVRMQLVERLRNTSRVTHPTNDDETRYPGYIGNFSKGLPHNALGEVEPAAYQALLNAMTGQAPCEAIPLGGTVKLANPQAAFAIHLEGMDIHNLTILPAPAFASAEVAAEAVELYWQAIARDIPFAYYGQEALSGAAISDLQTFPSYRQVDAATLFRGGTPGDWTGPYISQFLYLPVPYGALTMEQRYNVPIPGDDHMTGFDEWLAIQNGAPADKSNSLDETPRYLRTARDLAEWVHQDFTHQAFLNVALILNKLGKATLNPANPYLQSANQGGFVTFGAADVLSMVTGIACAALKAAWVQKWLFHRRLRPEAFGGRVHLHATGQATYPLHETLLASRALAETYTRFGTYLLPQAYPEGAPTHPAYPAGHATIAGACVTVLKAFYNESFVLPAPKTPSDDGLLLLDYRAGDALTVGGELNKLAANVAFGRNAAGVHWRSDAVEGLLLGEALALSILADLALTYHEQFAGFTLTRFDGRRVTIR